MQRLQSNTNNKNISFLTKDIKLPQPDPEGLDDKSSKKIVGWGKEYPLDAVMIRSDVRTVAEVMRRIHKDRYILDPEYQREFLWSAEKQSKLIESCLMRIPLPVLYVAENSNGLITVVDGLQRLSTFKNFLDGKLKLTGLGHSHPLNGKKVTDLPEYQIERIEDTQLILYILDSKAPEVAKLDIFQRVNSGVPLSRQQMRNAIYCGPATIWLRQAVSNKSFLTATSFSLDSKSMRDREAVNRFVSFSMLNWERIYNGDMDSFLAAGLLELQEIDEEKRNKLLTKFVKSMNFNFGLFGEHTFRRSLVENGDKTVINISLFDVLSVTLSKVSQENYNQFKLDIGKIIRDTIKNEQFIGSITRTTNSKKAVYCRYSIMEKALRKYL